jgi:DNA polymerase theta
MDLDAVHAKYGVDRATVQGLQERAARHAGMLAAFCERLGWSDLEALIAKFQARVLHGARPELMSLMEVDGVRAATARALYRAGLRTPEALAAAASTDAVASILAAARGGARGAAAQAHVRAQAARAVRGARELLGRRAREMRAEAAAALAVVDAAARQEEEEAAAAVAAAEARERLQMELSAGRGEERGAPQPRGAAAAGALRAFHAYAGAGDSDSEEGAAEEAVAAAAVSGGAAPAPGPPPDAWEFGGREGAFELATAAQVAAARGVLESGAYSTFAFWFDTTETGAAPGAAASTVPAGPAAARAAAAALHPPPGAGAGAGAGGAGGGVAAAGGGVRVDGVALSWRDAQAFYIPLHGAPPGVLAHVAALFASSALDKATFDLKSQMAALARAFGPAALGAPWEAALPPGSNALALRDPLVDLRVAAHLSTPDDARLSDANAAAPGGAAAAAKRLGGPYTAEGLAASRLGPAAAAAATRGMPPGAGRAAACRRAALLRAAWALVGTTLEAAGAGRALRAVEMPLVRILAQMEATGLALDLGALEAEEPPLRRRLAELEAQAAALAGGVAFNLASPVECSRVLYQDLGAPVPPSAESLKGGGGYSTRSEALRELAAAWRGSALPGVILEWRSLR